VAAVFAPLSTDRLTIRALRQDEATNLCAWRNEPEAARFQAWALPFPQERADEMVRSAMADGGPVDGHWWTGGVELRSTGELIGELVVNLTNGARTAEVGYTFTHTAWGRGYAVEGLTALLDWLFLQFPLTRAWGRMYPENRASAMVLERVGMTYEGHHQLSFWLDDENSDDWIFGMTRAGWEAWRDRPRTAPDEVRLVPITPANAYAVRALRTHQTQRSFVAPVVDSFADALVPEIVDGLPAVPWLRAIEADGELVGFVMLALPDAQHASPFLWRLLIDRMHQRRGIGSRVLDLVVDECRAWGPASLLTSWGQGKGSPERFYLTRGFVPTGRLVDGTEVEALLTIRPEGPTTIAP
jgi:RimJ/RimL family protein N-acetyltransferase